ncbi:MAG: CRTAC1 family protein [Planctomycetales bacterium]|nr:CRTAC1 family protein [Planctomycetales bacterium]
MLLALFASCRNRDEPSQVAAPAARPDADDAVVSQDEDNSPNEPEDRGGLFVDVTESLRIAAPSAPWPDGEYMTPEITAGGVAAFDYDGDGLMDLYQVNHCPAGSFTEPGPNRLFRQKPDGAFEEIPDAAGLDDPGYGHGVAVGDVDNDGDLDVYVANYGPNAFYLNEGGKFVNRTEAAGFSGDHWSSSAGFFDYDRDGDLDLYVVNFAIFDPELKCIVGDDPNDVDYCGPHKFDSVGDTLYRNNGDGTFTDVTEEAGIVLPGRGWGLACADVTGDGWCDVYVANDEEPAQLWVNQQDGTFEEEAVFRGCAYNMAGRVEAGMGVSIGDIDGDGRLDLLKTHLGGETNTLYLSGGSDELYTDQTARSSMGAVDRPFTGWGCGFLDFDHDGKLDMAVANGRVSKGVPEPSTRLSRFWSRFAEPNLLFAGRGDGRFDNVSDRAGAFGREPQISRGMAIADLDRDGDLDLAVQQSNNELRVYRNDAPPAGAHWLIVRPMTGKRDAYGALVTIEAGGRRFLRLAHPTYSFLASNDPRAHCGLGEIDKIDGVEVVWPSGRREQFAPPAVDQVVTLVEGEGESLDD